MVRALFLTAAAAIMFQSEVLVTSSHENDTYLSPEIQQVCIDAGKEYNICPELLMSIIEHESSGDPEAVSSAGCIGLMQVNPKWHRERMDKLGVTDLSDPEQNILTGTDYLMELAGEHGDLYLVLMTYNMGPRARELWERGDYSHYAVSVAERSEQLERARGK